MIEELLEKKISLEIDGEVEIIGLINAKLHRCLTRHFINTERILRAVNLCQNDDRIEDFLNDCANSF